VAKLENCEIEWDTWRGVLYVHNKDTGRTTLRICGLPKTKGIGANLDDGLIDITIGEPTLVALPERKI